MGSKSHREDGSMLPSFLSILFVILIYESLGDLIQYLQPDIDARLIRIDFSIFGVEPTFWMQRWIVPWLTDILSLAYISYYFIPVVFIVVLYLRNRMVELDRSVFVLVFGYYVSFIGYILFPAVGPRYALTHLYSVPLDGKLDHRFCQKYVECPGTQSAGLHAQRPHPDRPDGLMPGLSLSKGSLLSPFPYCLRPDLFHDLPEIPLRDRSSGRNDIGRRVCDPCAPTL